MRPLMCSNVLVALTGSLDSIENPYQLELYVVSNRKQVPTWTRQVDNEIDKTHGGQIKDPIRGLWLYIPTSPEPSVNPDALWPEKASIIPLAARKERTRRKGDPRRKQHVQRHGPGELPFLMIDCIPSGSSHHPFPLWTQPYHHLSYLSLCVYLRFSTFTSPCSSTGRLMEAEW